MKPFFRTVFAIATVVSVAACNDDEISGPDPDRIYTQIERLGNPLVSEVFFMKRDHGLHNSSAPATDVTNAFRTKIEAFVRDVAGRNATVQTTLSTVLVPDMLLVFPNRATSSAGWLSWALANGWGGRKLSDDVVDAGLAAVFGPLLDPTNVSPGLATDNVPANDKAFLTSFPYLAAATQ